MNENKNRVIFLKGRKTILRPMNKQTDIEKCLRWINDPEIRHFVKNIFPMTYADEEYWFDNMGRKKPNDISFAIETLDGTYIGNMGIHNINWKNGTFVTGAIIGEKEYWNKGYGTDAKMLLLDYAFNTLNLRKGVSTVIAYNKRSLNYSLHCGYKIEGVQKKQMFREGKYHDLLWLGLFKKDWLVVWKRYKKTGKVR